VLATLRLTQPHRAFVVVDHPRLAGHVGLRVHLCECHWAFRSRHQHFRLPSANSSTPRVTPLSPFFSLSQFPLSVYLFDTHSVVLEPVYNSPVSSTSARQIIQCCQGAQV
jgi:hypothetical protein